MNWHFLIWICALLQIQMLHGDTIRKDYTIMNGNAERAAQKEIYQKFGLRAIAAGGGAITVVRLVDLDVESASPLSIEEGRRLLIACAQILLKHLNGYRPLRPFLFEYPFPVNRISFAIFISPQGRMRMSKNDASIFSLEEGKIYYYGMPLAGDKSSTLSDVHEETYEEALQIVANEEKSLQPSQKLAPSRLNQTGNSLLTEFMENGEEDSTLPRYIGPQEEREMSWHLDDYANTVAKKYDMEFHRVGSFSDERDAIYSLMFINFHQMTLDQGKSFAVTLVKDFLRELQTSPAVKHYHEHRNNFYKKWRYPPLLTAEPIPEQMGLKIGFWDKNFDRPKKPYLAEIVFLHGDFYYYEADPETQAQQLILKESYADAISKQDHSTK